MKIKMMKMAMVLLAGGALTSCYAELVVGDWFQMDYGIGNGTALEGSGPAAGGQWNAVDGGHIYPGGNVYVDGDGQNVNIGSYDAGGVSGGAGTWQWESDALAQDYIYLNNNGVGDTNVNGTAVGSFRRLTLYTNGGLSDGLTAEQTWNITFIGAGNADDQGLYIMVNDGGTIRTGHNLGANAGAFTGYEQGENYMTFNDVTLSALDGGAELEFWLYTPDGSSGNLGSSALNGIQMQLVSIPEPATLGLVVSFGGGLLFVRRRFMI